MTVRHLDTIAIVRDPNRCGGDPTLAGTRAAVHDVVSYVQLYGGDLERVREEALPDLSLAQLRAAMEWYGEHQREIDELLRERRVEYERGVAGADVIPLACSRIPVEVAYDVTCADGQSAP